MSHDHGNSWDMKVKVLKTSPDDPFPMIMIDRCDFSFARMVGPVSAKEGYGLQAAEGVDEEAILRFCDRIYMAVREQYLSSLPASPIEGHTP